MDLEFAERECERLLNIGVIRSDVALLLSSWGLSSDDLEKANWHLHDIQKTYIPKIKMKQVDYKGIED